MRSTRIIALLFFTQVTMVKAQIRAGVELGASSNRLVASLVSNNVILDRGCGTNINFAVDLSLTKTFSVEFSPGLISKNYTLSNAEHISQKQHNTYLQFPFSIALNKEVASKISLTGAVGGYFSYWMAGRLKGSAPNAFEVMPATDGREAIGIENIISKYRFTEYDNRNELGWVGKIQLSYTLSKDFLFALKCRYFKSLTSQRHLGSEPTDFRYNETISVSIGVSYSIE